MWILNVAIAGIVITIVCLILPIHSGFAANLDAPLTQKPTIPTIRSEIDRGRDASQSCGLAVVSRTKQYIACIDRVIGTAAANNSSTPPFQLGVYSQSFIDVAIAYDVLQKQQTASNFQQVLTKRQYLLYQRAALKIGVSTGEVCEAIKIDCSKFKEMVHFWESQP